MPAEPDRHTASSSWSPRPAGAAWAGTERMRLLFVGDVVGRSGRAVLLSELPRLRAALALDAVIVNAENAAGGYGLTAAIAERVPRGRRRPPDHGQPCLGPARADHAHRSRAAHRAAAESGAGHAGPRGRARSAPPRGQRVLVVQVLGRLFMALADDPFRALDTELASTCAGRNGAGDRGRCACGGYQREAGAGAPSRWSGLPGRRHPHARADGGCAGPRRRLRLHHRSRHDRRLRQRDRHGQGGLAAEVAQRPAGGAAAPAMGEAMLCGVFVETDDRTGPRPPDRAGARRPRPVGQACPPRSADAALEASSKSSRRSTVRLSRSLSVTMASRNCAALVVAQVGMIADDLRQRPHAGHRRSELVLDLLVGHGVVRRLDPRA